MTNPARRLLGASMGSIATAAAIVFTTGLASPPPARGDETVTTADLLRWVDEFSNWGRWNNQLGAANFITERKRIRAAKLVSEGLPISLAHPVLKVPFDPFLPFLPESPTIAPQPTRPLDPDNTNPFFHWMNPPSYTSDRYNVSYHGSAHSHLDALCHYQLLGVLFDNLTTTDNNSAAGCVKYSVENLRDGVVTRGVLLDATLLTYLREPGRSWLAPGTHVHKKDIEALEKIEGVTITRGDVILLYTGRWARRAQLGPWPTSGAPTTAGVGVAGYDADAMQLVHEREVSFIGHDEWNDASPNGYPDFPNTLPVHTLAIRVMGVDIFDNLDLERLASTAKRMNRYEFMFSAAPMVVAGGTGSPLNPLAIF